MIKIFCDRCGHDDGPVQGGQRSDRPEQAGQSD